MKKTLEIMLAIIAIIAITNKLFKKINHTTNLIENRIITDTARMNDSTLIKNNTYIMIGGRRK